MELGDQGHTFSGWSSVASGQRQDKNGVASRAGLLLGEPEQCGSVGGAVQ